VERRLEKGLIGIIMLLFLSSILTTTSGSIIIPRFNEIRVYARIVDIREEDWHYHSTKILLKVQILKAENMGIEEMSPVEIGDHLEAYTFDLEFGPFNRGDLIKAHLKRPTSSSGEWSIVSYEKLFNSNYVVIGFIILNLINCLNLIIFIEITRWQNKNKL
jgi:hypothetical protein